MRRNITSCIKLVIFCLITVIVTTFLYKSIQYLSSNSNVLERYEKFHPRHGAFFGGGNKNLKNDRIDWNDYELITKEKIRTGIGEGGIAGYLKEEEKDEAARIFLQNGFNAMLSDLISLNRSVPDIRHKECV